MPTYAYVNNAFRRHSTADSDTNVDEHGETDEAVANIATFERGQVRQSAVSKQSKLSSWSADVSITSLSSSVRYRMLRLAAASSTSPLAAFRAAANDSLRHREMTASIANSHAECQL